MNKMFKKLIAATLALAMSIPAATIAPNAAGSDTDGLKLDKTAKLEDDGTYTVTLDAYATGKVTTTTTTTVKPTDFILVLDQSGSMENEKVSGIPTGYTVVNPNPDHSTVQNGNYYYKDGNNYYKVSVSEKVISSTTSWIGDDGKTYTEDQISNTWTDHLGRTYTGNYYVVDTLKTFHRIHWQEEGLFGVKKTYFSYLEDGTGGDTGVPEHRTNKELSAKGARESFQTKNYPAPYTCEFHNDDAPSNGNTSADDPFYVAASYIKVRKETVNTKEYTYSYVDGSGKVITIGTYADGETTNATLYTTSGTKEGTRLEALQYAANKFIGDIHNNANTNNVDHRVAIVGFASNDYGNENNEYYYSNTELFIGANQYNYSLKGKNSTFNTRGNLASDHYSDAFQNARTTAGYNNLQSSINNLAAHGGTHPNYGFEMANGIFGANPIEDRNRVIIFLTDGQPGDKGYDSKVADATVAEASISKTTHRAKVYSVGVLNPSQVDTNIENFLNNVSSDNTHQIATDVSSLNSFFENITNTTTSTEASVELGENAYLEDVISDEFEWVEGQTEVKAYTARHTGYESFAPRSEATNLSVTHSGNKVKVSGFNYTDPANLVTTNSAGGSVKANGNKLIVEITGLKAKNDTTGTVSTNKPESGIYGTINTDETAIIKAFEQPYVNLDKHTFVLDFGLKAPLDINGTHLDVDGYDQFTTPTTTVTKSYGDVTVEGSNVVYTPTTMEWNGVDTFYVFNDSTTNSWSQVNVMPANNVYYEDTFNSITYTGTWNKEGNATVTEQNTDNGHGVESNYNNDLGNTAGTLHSTSTAGDSVVLTFTGTGIDVYGKTTGTNGTVTAKLQSHLAGGTLKTVKYSIIDTVSESGDYNTIPYVFFKGLDYGTYTLTIKNSGQVADRPDFHVDGVRIYNPLSAETEATDVVADAYGDEIGAEFTSIRELLLQNVDDNVTDAQLDGTVFIDKVGDSKSVAEYKTNGPKNEVYLSKGQSIAFAVDAEPEEKVQVGLKSTNGTETSAKFSKGENTTEVTVSSSLDQYYTVEPNSEGLVLITNNGNGILALTNIKTTGSAEITSFSLNSMVTYANTFDSLPVVAYEMVEEIPETPEVPEVPETPTQQHWLVQLFKAISKWFGK